MNLKIKQALAVAGLALVGSAAQATIPQGDIVFDIWNQTLGSSGFTLDTGLNVATWNPAQSFSVTVTNPGVVAAFNGGLTNIQWTLSATNGSNVYFSTTATSAATLGTATGEGSFEIGNAVGAMQTFYTTMSNGQTSVAADNFWAANASQFSGTLADPTDIVGKAGNANFAALDPNANASLYGGHWTLSFLDATGAAITAGTAVSAVLSWAPNAVPLPAAVWLLGSGLMGLAGVGRRKIAAA